jgi:hypothetical protein
LSETPHRNELNKAQIYPRSATRKFSRMKNTENEWFFYWRLDRVARWFLFRPKIPKFWSILLDLGMENVDKYHGPLEYFTTNGYILWSVGNFIAIWYIFHRFGLL